MVSILFSMLLGLSASDFLYRACSSSMSVSAEYMVLLTPSQGSDSLTLHLSSGYPISFSSAYYLGFFSGIYLVTYCTQVPCLYKTCVRPPFGLLLSVRPVLLAFLVQPYIHFYYPFTNIIITLISPKKKKKEQ